MSSDLFRLMCLMIASSGFVLLSPGIRATDALTQHYNNARTGAILDETVLTTGNVNSTKFGKLWTLYADGQVVAQPLYVSGLLVDTRGIPGITPVNGTFNAVIIATMHNTVYVYDADKENRGANGRTIPLWAKWLGPPRLGGKDIDMWSTNDPEWGILSTPVVNTEKTTLYLVSWHNDGPTGLQYRLHALNLQNGTDRLPPVNIGPSSSDASQPCKPGNAFNPCAHKQRVALLLDNGILYVAFGGDGNRGALFAFDAQTLAQQATWNSTPTGVNGGLWQSGQGLSANGNGEIYVITGNGTFDANTGGRNYGSSFVKLRLESGNLQVKDYFTPCNYQFLNSNDLDLGSGGAVLLPTDPPRMIGGGKEGVLYVLAPGNLGKYVAAPTAPNCQNANIVQQVKAFDVVTHNNVTHWPNIHGSPVFWNGPDSARVYVWGENSNLKAYLFSQGKLQDVDHARTSAFRPPLGMPGGMLAISANGNKAGSGILWAVVPLNGDANQQRGVQGIVLALDAQNVNRTLWTSEDFAQRDHLGLFAKFNPPLIANGKVFVATYGDQEPLQVYGNQRPTQFPANYYVAVYGLLGTIAPPPPVVDQDRDDVTVLRAATSPLSLDMSTCRALDAVSLDCTDALAQQSGAPALHRVIFPATRDTTGCVLLRVTTVSKDTDLANASGIGFWSTQAAAANQAPENSGQFVAKAQLKAVGTAALVSGASATLHDFVGVANCQAGGTDSLDRIFKPYMQFTEPDGTILHNWDLSQNYRISRTTTAFDRSADVLRH